VTVTEADKPGDKVGRLFVAFSCGKTSKREVEKYGFSKLEHDRLHDSVHRLVGRQMAIPGIVQGEYMLSPGLPDNENVIMHLIKLKEGEDVVVLEYPLLRTDSESKLLKLTSRPTVRDLCQKYGMTVNSDQMIRGVVGVAILETINFMKFPSEWFIEQSESGDLNFYSEITRQVVSRVAVERSLLIWATTSKVGIANLTFAAHVAFKVRRWPVELLIDNESLSAEYKALRSNFNLPGARAEILERARSWWAGAAAVLAILSLIVSILQLFPPTAR